MPSKEPMLKIMNKKLHLAGDLHPKQGLLQKSRRTRTRKNEVNDLATLCSLNLSKILHEI